jgi:hypothetical protein
LVSVVMVLSFIFGGASRCHCEDRHALDAPLRSGALGLSEDELARAVGFTIPPADHDRHETQWQ